MNPCSTADRSTAKLHVLLASFRVLFNLVCNDMLSVIDELVKNKYGLPNNSRSVSKQILDVFEPANIFSLLLVDRCLVDEIT